MTNRVTIIGKLVDAPKIRSFEQRGGTIEIVSLWLEVKDENRTDRFTVEINDGKAATAAKAMKQDVIVEVTGKLRHDRDRLALARSGGREPHRPLHRRDQ